jgi:hypothetical protein
MESLLTQAGSITPRSPAKRTTSPTSGGRWPSIRAWRFITRIRPRRPAKAIAARSWGPVATRTCFTTAGRAARNGARGRRSRYELNYLPARDADDDQQIPFYLDDPGRGVLPDWDEPVLPREGRTTWDSPESLMPRQRGLAWRTQVRPPKTGVSQRRGDRALHDAGREPGDGRRARAAGQPESNHAGAGAGAGHDVTIRQVASDRSTRSSSAASGGRARRRSAMKMRRW